MTATFPQTGTGSGGPETDPVAQPALAAHIATQPAHGGDLAGAARPPTAHAHPQSDVTGLTAALTAKQDASTAATDAELTAAVAGVVPKALVDAKGDLIVATANDTPARLAVGGEGTVPVSRAAAASGIAWEAPGAVGANPQPTDFGLETWAFDPVAASGTFTPTAATLYIVRQPVRRAATLLRVLLSVSTAGTGATPLAAVFAGLYDVAGVLRSKTADASVTFATAGIRTVTLVDEAGQTSAINPTDGYCWLAFLVGTQSTTALAIRSAGGIAGVTNLGLNQTSTPPARSLSKAAVGSALPATIDVTTFTANNTTHFCAFGT